MWDEMKSYRQRSSEMFDDFREDELERAYKKGCEHGYKKAMEELRYGERGGGYGERGGFGGRSWTISEGYGQRDDDGYGERRGRDSRGRYR